MFVLMTKVMAITEFSSKVFSQEARQYPKIHSWVFMPENSSRQ